MSHVWCDPVINKASHDRGAWFWMQALKKATQVAKKAEPKQAKQVKSGGNPFQRAATQVRTAETCSVHLWIPLQCWCQFA
jgi:hypothetical protein